MDKEKITTLWSGEEGSCVFTQPFINHKFQLLNLPDFLQRIESTGDERSFVIVSAVVVER
jgi:hypothetical protein